MTATINPRNRIPGLLFWQVGVLAGIFGAIGSAHLPVGLAGLIGIGIICARKNGYQWLFLGLCFVMPYITSLASMPAESPAPAWFTSGEAIRIEGDIVSVTGLPDRRLRIILENVRPENSRLAALPGRVSWTWAQGTHPDIPRPLPGQKATLTSKILPASGFANKGLGSSAAYWKERNVWYTAWNVDNKGNPSISGTGKYAAALREKCRARFVEALGGSALGIQTFRSRPEAESTPTLHGMQQASAILPALLFGDRYSLDSPTLEKFTKAGLMHSLALSGQHLALAASIAALMVWCIGWAVPSVFIALPQRSLILLCGLPLSGLYLWLGDAPPSLVRASVMMLAGAVLCLKKRPCTLLDILFFTALCFLVFWPRAVFDISVQLSVLSVTGIALALPMMHRLRLFIENRLEHSRLKRPAIWATMLLVTSCAVQITTLPVLIHTFGRLSPLFILNLVWLPWLALMVLPLAALGLFLVLVTGSSAISSPILMLAAMPAACLITGLDYLNAHSALPMLMGLKPTAWATLGFAACIVALATAFGRQKIPRATLILSACALFLLPAGALQREVENFLAARRGEITLRLLDVGQGQSLVLEWPNGRMVIDGGGMTSPRFEPGRDIVAQALTVNHPPRVDAVMASHGDMDHTRGLISLLQLFSVGEVMHSTLPLASGTGDHLVLEETRQKEGIPLRTLQRGDIIPLGQSTGLRAGQEPVLELEILHPPPTGRFSSNNGSLVVRLVREYQGSRQGLAIFCGDAEKPALRQILKTGQDLSAQVLVLPHHGSANALVPEFYKAVNPELALISCGAYNSFGFPRQEIVTALEELNIPILTSADKGEMSTTWHKSAPSPTIWTAR